MGIIGKILLALIVIAPIIDVAAADTMTGIFNPGFKSLQIKVEGNDYAPPIITLNTDDRVIISFDELSEEHRYMRYSIIHCNADWQPSGLVEAEYLEGFNLGNVDDYEFSAATSVHYVHYRILLPNDEVRFTVSGNYLLQVFPEENPEEVLLQARFSVTEATAVVSGEVTSRTDIDYNDKHQQLSVIVDAERVGVGDMYNDLILVIEQDARQDNRVVLTRPMRIAGEKAYYEHLRPMIFDAGNEYRRMEIVSTTYPGMGVEYNEFIHPYYHATLTTSQPRAESNYLYDQTQFGRYKIHEYNSTDHDTQADYMVAHFTLSMPELSGVDIFLDGDFTYRRFDPESMMIYNRATGLYEKSLLLKQGAYNFQYLVVTVGSTVGETATVEGDYYQTIHEYTLKLYHRHPGERYDRLVGATVLYSGR